MSWLAALWPFAIALALLWGPGLIVTALLRVGWVARAALAGVAGVAALGLAGTVFGSAGFAFQAWQPFAVAVPVGALGLLVRNRMLLPAERRPWPLAAGWAIGIAVIAVVAFWQVPDPSWFSQTYDNVFHLSAIASIVDGGSASSLTLRTLIETTESTAFYPAAWHTLVAGVAQVSGAGVGLAANGAWLAVCAAVWLPGVAWLAQAVLHRLDPRVVGAVALVVGALFPWMPYTLLGWGTLYPTFLATAVLPVAVAIPVVTWTRLKGAHRPAIVLVAGGVAMAGALFALGVSQPRVIPGWLVLILPGAAAVAWRSAVGRWRAGGRRRRRMLWIVGGFGAVALVAAGAAFLYAVVALGLFTRPLDDRLGGPQAAATQSVLDGLLQVAGLAGATGAAGVVTWPSLLLAALVVIGAVAAWRRGAAWLVVSYALVAVLFALAAGSDSVVAKLATGIWYKDRYRLASLLSVVGVVLATWGVVALSRWLARRSLHLASVRIAIVGTAAASAGLVLSLTGSSATIGAVFRLPPSDPGGQIVSASQLDFLARVADEVPAGQRVLGDPWDGSTLVWWQADREPVFPHVNGTWDAARLALAYSLDAIEDDPAVCAALDDLRVRYVVYDPHEFGGGDPAGNHFPAVHRAVEAGLFEQVATDGRTTLWRIDRCGPLPAG